MEEALLALGGNMFTSIVNGLWNQQLANQQRNWNEKMYKQQYEDNINLWNMQNEYNLPSADMQRRIDAGINPLFDQTSSVAGAISPAQPMSYERAQAPSMLNPIGAYLDAKAKIASIENTKADTALKSNQTLTEEQRRENLIKERDQMDANITKLLADARLTDKEREKVQQFIDYADDIYESQINLNDSTKDLKDSEKKKIEELLPGEKELQSMSMENLRQQWKKWQAEINHLVHEDALLAKQAKYYLISLLNGGFAGTGLSINNMLISALIDDDVELDDDLRKTLRNAVGGNVPAVDAKNKLKRGVVPKEKWSSSFSSNTLLP